MRHMWACAGVCACVRECVEVPLHMCGTVYEDRQKNEKNCCIFIKHLQHQDSKLHAMTAN